GHAWQELRDLRAALAVSFERVARSRDVGMPAQERESLADDELVRARLAIVSLERRLVLEKINLRRRAHHVHIDHALRASREMRWPGRERIYQLRFGFRGPRGA